MRKISKGLLIVSSMLALSACGSESSSVSVTTQEESEAVSTQETTELAAENTTEESSTESSSETETTQESQTEETPTETETPNPYDEYVHGIYGIQVYEEYEVPVSDRGDVYLKAHLSDNLMKEEGYYSLDGFYVSRDNKAIICYSIFSEARGGYDGDGYGDTTRKQYLTSYDIKTDTKLGELLVCDDEIGLEGFYMTSEGGIILWKMEEGYFDGTLYDYDLNEVGSLSKKADDFGMLSNSGDYFYFTRDNGLWKKDTKNADAEAEQIVLSDYVVPSCLNGIYTDDAGTDYVIFDGMACDLKSYTVVANISTGEVLYMKLSDESMTSAENNMFVIRQPLYEGGVSYEILAEGTDPYIYTWEERPDVIISFLENDKVLFGYTDYSEYPDEPVNAYYELYDAKNGELLGATSFKLENAESWFAYTPFIPEGENVLVMPVSDMSMNVYFYCWDYSMPGDSDRALAEVYQVAAITTKAEPEFICDPAELVARECQPEFADLRAQADAMEEQYGVDIFIGNECGGIVGGYAALPISDYYITEEALNVLEAQLAKYPEGFFRQMSYGYQDGVDIYLAGLLIGTTSDGLDYAGGFQNDYNNSYTMFIDATLPYSIDTTFHHELSHAIDQKIGAMVLDGLSTFDENYWLSLNPADAGYTYSYAQFGYPEWYQYYYDGINGENAYYVDDYSMTFPTEDRARLFENACSDYGWVDWQNVPHLKAKLDYYALCIREVFDTTGWDNVMWEK